MDSTPYPALKPVPNLSKEDAAYEQLRRAILSNVFVEGQRLIPGELARQLGASSIPIRNALTRLEAEQLVTRIHNRGFVVRSYSEKEVRDLYAILPMLEGLAARLAAVNVGEEGLSKLRDCVAEMEATLARGDFATLREVNRRFHVLIHEASGNEQLAAILPLLRDRAQRYRVAYYDLPGIPEQTVREHREALQALEDRDPEKAEEVVRRDVATTGNSLLEVVARLNPKPVDSRCIQCASRNDSR